MSEFVLPELKGDKSDTNTEWKNVSSTHSKEEERSLPAFEEQAHTLLYTRALPPELLLHFFLGGVPHKPLFAAL